MDNRDLIERLIARADKLSANNRYGIDWALMTAAATAISSGLTTASTVTAAPVGLLDDEADSGAAAGEP